MGRLMVVEQGCPDKVHIDAEDLKILGVQLEEEGIVLSPEGMRQYHALGARHRRQAQIMERGWEPWHRPNEMPMGLVERHRWRDAWEEWSGIICILSCIVGASAGFAFLALLDGNAFWPNLTVILGFSLCFLCLGLFAGVAQHRSEKALRWERYQHQVFTGVMPVWVWEKYHRDRNLFDRVYIASYDASLFQQVRIWVDPLLVGRIGDALFLGAVWDLSKDIEGVEAQDLPLNLES